jgi:hypothetical protein
MPVPKKKQKLYGKVVGHMINSGKSLEEAKDIADKAVHVGGKKGKPKKSGKKRGSSKE